VSEFFQACKPESATAYMLSDACVSLVERFESPIDIYYSRVEKLVIRAQKAEQDAEIELIPLLFLRLISATESYIRSLLSYMPVICPLVWRHCAKEVISLGAGFHYGKDSLPVAVIEHVSFCTKGEIQKQTQKVADLQVASDGSLRAAVESFEAISQLRHSIVHSYDELFFNNIKELGMADRTGTRYAVSISPLVFQRFVSVCHSLVRAYNRTLLDRTLSKWIAESQLSFQWGKDKAKIKPLFDLFYSERDEGSELNAYRAFLAVRRKNAARAATV